MRKTDEGFGPRFKKNMILLWLAMNRREIFQVILLFLIDGVTNPSFNDFAYFFQLNVIGLSKF